MNHEEDNTIYEIENETDEDDLPDLIEAPLDVYQRLVETVVDRYINELFHGMSNDDFSPLEGTGITTYSFNFTLPSIYENVLQQSLQEQPDVIKTDRIIKLDEKLFRDYEDKTKNNCAICLDDFEEESKVSEINECKHLFHKDCIIEWDKYNECVKCPVCRTEIKT